MFFSKKNNRLLKTSCDFDTLKNACTATKYQVRRTSKEKCLIYNETIAADSCDCKPLFTFVSDFRKRSSTADVDFAYYISECNLE